MSVWMFVGYGIAFLFGYIIGEMVQLKWQKYKDEVDGVAFIANGKERFILTTPHSTAEKKDRLIFKVGHSIKDN